jgi:DNA polymerase-3 subunit delta'
VGKSEAAVAFAAGLACADGGCGACNNCRRVQKGLHPDVEMVAPEGNFILVDQIRDINYHSAYRPYEARAKVYVLLEAEKFNAEAANAFLKTLEEPPPHVHFLLVSDHAERMLPTIVSRCQSVAFSPVSVPSLAADLTGRLGLPQREADLIARVAGGNLGEARELATSESARRQRDHLLDLARDLPTASLMDIQTALDEVMNMIDERVEERMDESAGQLQQALEWAGDARTRRWLEKRHEEKLKRQRRRLSTQGLHTVTHMFAAWYRDLVLVSSGAEEAALNQDRLPELRAASHPGALLSYTQAVMVIRRAQERLRYNVDARCAIEDMFYSIKEALTQWPML